MPITTWSQSRQAMEQQSSPKGVGMSNPQLNSNLGVNPTVPESVLISFNPLNPVFIKKPWLTNQMRLLFYLILSINLFQTQTMLKWLMKSLKNVKN